MSLPALAEDEHLKEIHLLIFHMMEVRMGVDVEQVSAMAQPERLADKGLPIFPFHEKVPFQRRGGPVIYKSPMVLMLRKEGSSAGVLIDQPEEILSLPVRSIQPLPRLLAENLDPPVVWGAALVKEKVILLVDFHRLPGGKVEEKIGASRLEGTEEMEDAGGFQKD